MVLSFLDAGKNYPAGCGDLFFVKFEGMMQVGCKVLNCQIQYGVYPAADKVGKKNNVGGGYYPFFSLAASPSFFASGKRKSAIFSSSSGVKQSIKSSYTMGWPFTRIFAAIA